MIYFDNAASTPLCASAKEALLTDYANPSSPHALGLASERALKTAARDLSNLLGCEADELIFTSGATEANNLGIIGAALALQAARGKERDLRLYCAKLEHPSVSEPLKYLATLPGFKLEDADENADFICASHVNGETGDILSLNRRNGAVLFVDGAQAFGKLPVLEADIYSFSGHKFGGPTGVGGLVVRKGLRLLPLMYGGGQQGAKRPGTENVSAIVAMAAAAKESYLQASSQATSVAVIKASLAKLADELPDVFINQLTSEASPFILNMSFLNVPGETLVNMLSAQGIYASMGAACRVAKKEPALLTAGFSRARVDSAVRFSFSYANTLDEARQAKEVIKVNVQKLRSHLLKGKRR